MEKTPIVTNEKPGKHRKKTVRAVRRTLTIILLFALLGGGFFCIRDSLRAQYTVNYQAYTASIGSISNSLSFNGTLQAVNSKTYTANSACTVRSVYVSAGDKVKKGDKLLRLSNGQSVESEFDGEINVLDVCESDSVSAGASLASLSIGSPVIVRFPYLNDGEYAVSGIVEQISGFGTVDESGESEEALFKVIVKPDSSENIRYGMSVTVSNR